MRILFVSHCFPPAIDGGAILFSQIAQGLARRGIETEVITSNRFSSDDFINPKAKKITPAWEKKEKLLINRLDVFASGRLLFHFFPVLKLGPVFKNWKEILKKRKVDWVIAGPLPTMAIIWGYLLAKRNKAKLAFIPCFHIKEKGHQNKILLKLLGKADLIFCLSEREKNEYRKMELVEKKLIVISGVVDDLIFKYRPSKAARFSKTPVVLFLGVKAAHKKIELLIKAMKILWKKGEKAKLVIAGPETLSSPKIKKSIIGLDKIVWLDKVSQKKKITLLDKATVLVNPSCHESFGIVFAEAWARKKPVIGADIPVLREIIFDQKDGLLFKKGSADDLAKKIKALVRNESLARQLGKNGYNKIVKRCRQKTVVKKIFASLS